MGYVHGLEIVWYYTYCYYPLVNIFPVEKPLCNAVIKKSIWSMKCRKKPGIAQLVMLQCQDTSVVTVLAPVGHVDSTRARFIIVISFRVGLYSLFDFSMGLPSLSASPFSCMTLMASWMGSSSGMGARWESQ